MSAYIVEKLHIDSILEYASREGMIPPTSLTITEVGNVLWKENYRSVNYRYHEKNKFPGYVCANPMRSVSAIEFLKLLKCLDYQSCERPDYSRSKACKIIKDFAFSAIPNLEGYYMAPWGIEK